MKITVELTVRSKFKKSSFFGAFSYFKPGVETFSILIICMLLVGKVSLGQGIGISESAITADVHAILELRSTLKGFLAPRMTTVQRGVLGATPPAAGMLVYDTDTKSFWYYDNGGWNAIAAGANVGTVTNFSAGDLSPLFTTTEATTTTTPALSFSITNAGAYRIFGNNSNASASPAYFTPLLASGLFQNQGTTTTVLHGNAAGNPSWSQIVTGDVAAGAIDLTTQVSGILPTANGGTGVANNALSTLSISGNFATTLTLGGTTNITLPTSGTLMANPLTTGGDLLYGGVSGIPSRLPNGSAGQVLQSNGTTLAPSWVTPAAGTVTSVSTASANNGVTATWSMTSPTPALTIGLGSITPVSVNGLTITSNGSNTLNIATGKTLTVSNSLSLAGTDASTLNIGTGGTLGSNAFTSTAYAPIASPSFTGTVSLPTPFNLGGTSVTTTGTELNYLDGVAGTTGTSNSNLVLSASPTFTGTPTLPTGTIATTQAFGDNSTALATTAFVQSETPSYSRVTGANATTTGQSLTNITGLTFAAAAGTTYEFEAVLSVGTNAVTTGTGYGVNYSGTVTAIEAIIAGSTSTTQSKILRISALNTPAAGFLTSNGSNGGISIKGVIVTNTAGNITIQHLKTSSGTSTVFVNSYLKVIKIQ
jgi:hypothetical protein